MKRIERRTVLLTLSGIALFAAGYFLHDALTRNPTAAKQTDVRWYPPIAEVKPRWSINVSEGTRWAGVSEDGDSVFWVEAKGRGGDGRLHQIQRDDPGRFEPIVVERVSQCYAGCVRNNLVAVGLYEGGSWSLLIRA